MRRQAPIATAARCHALQVALPLALTWRACLAAPARTGAKRR
jgi:hypothetical protein